jgi:hypothetical protein
MTMEKLIQLILNKSKDKDVDLLIAKAQVREDFRLANELTEEIDDNLDQGLSFMNKLMNYPQTLVIFGKEHFDTGKTCADYLELMKKENMQK